MNEPGMPAEPETSIGIERNDDGSVVVVFSGGATAADLATAFASLPADHQVDDIFTRWFSEAEECTGQDEPDQEHDWPVVSLFLEPAELPSEVTS